MKEQNRTATPKPATIVLNEEEWTDQPRFVDVAYPAKPIQDFINWLRWTKAWWEDVDLVHRRVMKMNAELAAARSSLPRRKVPLTKEQRKAIALTNLAKARKKAPVTGG